ncbi:hypothetical protein H920_13574 [Fukomys damarensis]|uniref:Uncharacterized protein n=1 Tax=Fukomys damarensis TaxID=885580 RepID=A0A091CYY7_FUKDA|nr:hypothetical protein H920_13574 [Fukomys damarensis]
MTLASSALYPYRIGSECPLKAGPSSRSIWHIEMLNMCLAAARGTVTPHSISWCHVVVFYLEDMFGETSSHDTKSKPVNKLHRLPILNHGYSMKGLDLKDAGEIIFKWMNEGDR